MADGNLVVSFRNISTVAIVDRRTGEVTWSSAARRWPSSTTRGRCPTATSHLRQRPHRRDHPAPYSRVIEVDRARARSCGSITTVAVRLLQPLHLGGQRLANGNTLICEAVMGASSR